MEASTDKRPSNRQWWGIAQLLLKQANLPIPQNRKEASDLITQLNGRTVQPTGTQAKSFLRKEVIR